MFELMLELLLLDADELLLEDDELLDDETEAVT